MCAAADSWHPVVERNRPERLNAQRNGMTQWPVNQERPHRRKKKGKGPVSGGYAFLASRRISMATNLGTGIR